MYAARDKRAVTHTVETLTEEIGRIVEIGRAHV